MSLCQANMTSLFCFSSLVMWTITVYCCNSWLTSGVEDKTLYLLQQSKGGFEFQE